MYRNPHLAARARMARERNMWTIRTTPKTSDTMASTCSNLSSSVTAAILTRPRYHKSMIVEIGHFTH